MYYILKIASSYIKNNKINIFASLDGEHTEPNGIGYLFPRHLDEYEKVTQIDDIHGWIGKKPFSFFGYPISDKFKTILKNFNLYDMKFLKTKVLFKKKFYDYYGWNLNSNGFDKFVDFESSTFCEWKQNKKYSDLSIKFKKTEEITDYELDNDWWSWGFDRAVMKPEFKEIDCMAMPYPYGILISERLKNALEEANLTGFEIKPFPVAFEYL